MLGGFCNSLSNGCWKIKKSEWRDKTEFIIEIFRTEGLTL